MYAFKIKKLPSQQTHVLNANYLYMNLTKEKQFVSSKCLHLLKHPPCTSFLKIIPIRTPVLFCLSFSSSCPFISFPFPALCLAKYLCGPASPLNSNSTHKQTALHAVITNPKLPDIKRATFHPTTKKQGERRKRAERRELPCLSLLLLTDAVCNISLLKCDWEER